ncbi:pilus assembly FimT family protein [Desulfurobacterium sp.]
MKNRGFTLTELIVAIAVVLILSAIAVPQISTWIHQIKVKQIAEELTSDLMWAQSLAMEKGGSAVAFDTNAYYIAAPYGSGTTPVLIKQVSLPSEITLTPVFSLSITDDFNGTLPTALPIVVFKRNKLLYPSGHIDISGYGISYRIIVNQTSGRIYLQRL